jgi:hypothetical protein
VTSEGKLELFDFEMLRNIWLSKQGEQDFEGYKVVKYSFDPVEIDLEPIVGYPVKATCGNFKDIKCGSTVDGKTCNDFLKSEPENYILVEEITGIAVAQNNDWIVLKLISMCSSG